MKSANDINVATNADRIRGMRLIDEIAYQYKIAKIPVEERTFVKAWETAQEMPTIDAAPVVRGEWKLYGNDDDSGMSYWCTACNFQLSEDLFYSEYKNGRWIENGVFKYCPNCGAKMQDKHGITIKEV